ncbi:MAG: organic solvent tolerance protein OstA [Treponema sp.]|nr:organic solvent tolerance protein OstA [Treponema sp.]
MKKFFLMFFLILFCSLAFFGEKISFNADYMYGSVGNSNEKTILERNATISTDSFRITANFIELEGDNYRYVTASGYVSGNSKKSGFDFWCDKLFYDRETKLVYFEGNVTLKDTTEDVEAHSQLMEYDLNTEIALLQVNVTLNKNQNKGSGALAVYKKNEKTVDLTGNPKIVRGEDIFTAQKITLNIETEEIILDGKVSGNVKSGEN